VSGELSIRELDDDDDRNEDRDETDGQADVAGALVAREWRVHGGGR
jgi:hypothetical protein